LKNKFNLNSIKSNILKITSAINTDRVFNEDILFIKGEYSNYIDNQGLFEAKKSFPKLSLVTIENSSHWIHYENQKKFYSIDGVGSLTDVNIRLVDIIDSKCND